MFHRACQESGPKPHEATVPGAHTKRPPMPESSARLAQPDAIAPVAACGVSCSHLTFYHADASSVTPVFSPGKGMLRITRRPPVGRNRHMDERLDAFRTAQFRTANGSFYTIPPAHAEWRRDGISFALLKKREHRR